MVNILLCGGSGVRLWPLSREFYPKQFCNLTGECSLFQETLLRNGESCEKTVVVTNERHYPLAKTQLDQLELENVEFILEPVGRNTAPAITLACLSLSGEDTVFVTPSDHYIKDGNRYNEVVNKAKTLAGAGYLVTFGVKPYYPETGFGYIEAEGEDAISFKEKPGEKTAREYLDAGKYYWNSGMFVFKVKTFLDEIGYHSGGILSASKEAFEHREYSGGITRITKSYMEKIPADSVDYAVLEKSNKIKMVVLDVGWSDLGSFEAIYGISTRDLNGNVSASGNIFLNSKNNLVVSKNRPVTLIDADDLVVVDTDDAVLISKKGSSQKIKQALPEIENISPGITKKHTILRETK